MAYNNLSGPIPTTFANFSNLQRLVIKPGNPYLCGPIPPNLPFQLCNDLDLSCLKIPVVLRPVCPPNLEPTPEYAGFNSGGGVGIAPGSGSSSSDTPGGGNVAGAASSTPPPAAVPLPPDPNAANYDSNNGGSDVGAIVGGVVGGVLGLLLLIGTTLAIALMVVDHRQRRRRQLQNFDDKPSRPSLLPFFSHEELEGSPPPQVHRASNELEATGALVPTTISPQESHPLLSTLLSSMRLSQSNSIHMAKYSSGLQELQLSDPSGNSAAPVLNDLSIDPNGE
jgi:hypothetical protein